MYLYFSFENLGNFLNSNIFIRKHLLLEAIFFYIFYIHHILIKIIFRGKIW